MTSLTDDHLADAMPVLSSSMSEKLTTLVREMMRTPKHPVEAQVVDRGLDQWDDEVELEPGQRVEICPTNKISNDRCQIPMN